MGFGCYHTEHLKSCFLFIDSFYFCCRSYKTKQAIVFLCCEPYAVVFTEWTVLNCPSTQENTAERTELISVAFIPVLFIFHLFSVIQWFWSWVCLTFSSPRVRGILHSVSLYPQPPAACLNQKQRQPQRREREKERQSVVVGLQREWETEDMEGKWSKHIHFQSPNSQRFIFKFKDRRHLWGLNMFLNAPWCDIFKLLFSQQLCLKMTHQAWKVRRDRHPFHKCTWCGGITHSRGMPEGEEREGGPLCLPHWNNCQLQTPAVT